MQLPKGLTLPQTQTQWAAILNPLLGNASLNSLILSDIALINGSTTVNHTLGRPLTGWRIIRINGAATVYDNQDINSSPGLTLLLVSNAAVIVSLEVF